MDYINQVICGDSAAVMAQLPDACIDTVLTSPPYGDMRVYAGNVNYTFDVFRGQVNQLWRVCKPGAVVVWVVRDAVRKGGESGDSFRQALYFMEAGFLLHDTMIYAKNHFVPLTHRRYEQAWEYMFVFSKGAPKTFNGIKEPCKHQGEVVDPNWQGATTSEKGCALRARTDKPYTIKADKLHSNIWYYSPASKFDDLASKHPAVFPWELARDMINTWSNPNDIVLDLMAGSGTTLVVAKWLGRQYVGIDIAQTYVDLCQQRLAKVEVTNV